MKLCKKVGLSLLLLVITHYPTIAAVTIDGKLATESDNGSDAGFDCSKPQRGVEEAICSDSALGSLDKEMAKLYEALVVRLPSVRKRAFQQEQREWLKQRNKCSASLPSDDCLEPIYQARIEELKKLSRAVFSQSALYVLNISSPTEIIFFCEQSHDIALIDSTGREKYIPIARGVNTPFQIFPEVAEDLGSCGMGKCQYSDLLGNTFNRAIDPCFAMSENERETDEQLKKRCDRLRKGRSERDADEQKEGILINSIIGWDGDFKQEGCRELETVNAICVTERRAIYIHSSDDKRIYTSYDFKRSDCATPSTDISSDKAKWIITSDGSAAIHFEKKKYEYHLDVQHVKSSASGTVSIVKDGGELQSESCKLLYINKDLLPVKPE